MAIVMIKNAPKKAVKKAVKKTVKTVMKKKTVKKVSKIGRKSAVFQGQKEKTKTGLKKSDLVKSKSGKIVSKKQQAAGKTSYKRIKSWTTAFQKARKELKITGFVPCGGKTAAGKAFLDKCRQLYSKM